MRLPFEISGIQEVEVDSALRYTWTMSRRAGDFYRLDAALKRRFPGEYDRLPKLRRGMHSTGATLEERAQVLAVYLQCIVASSEMHCPELVKFCYPKIDYGSPGLGANIAVGEEAFDTDMQQRVGRATTLDRINLLPLSRVADRFEFLESMADGPMTATSSSCMESDDDR